MYMYAAYLQQIYNCSIYTSYGVQNYITFINYVTI